MGDNNVSYAKSKRFPENFLLGTATGAYQVEGAWDEDKAVTIWDEYFHANEANKRYRYFLNLTPTEIQEYQQKGIQPRVADLYKGMAIYEVPSSAVADGTHFNYNGDVAADTYHKTDVDVALLKDLGVKVYNFSISMARIVPHHHDHIPGQGGIEYYSNLIDKLIENGITPLVSLYHYDMPTDFALMGGLTNHVSHSFFVNYARICFENFGDRVKHWTASADIQLAIEGYGSEHFAPGFQEHKFSGYADYRIFHNCFITIASVYKLYNEEFRETQHGEIGVSIEGTWFYPLDPTNPEHERAAMIARHSTFGMIMYVIGTGKYPDEFLKAVDQRSKIEGIRINRVHQFTEEEQALIKGCFDFIIFNYYSSVKVRPMTEEEITNEPNLKRRDRGFFMDFESTSPAEVYDGFLNCLKWIDEALDKPKIFIGENGFPEDEGVDETDKKISYHTGILNKVLEALDKNINVFGYCVWSFLDTLEFTFGYGKKFGIYAVDFNDESRRRSKKKSFSFFQNLFKSKRLPAAK